VPNGGRPVELTSTEYSLLELLVRHAGQPGQGCVVQAGLGPSAGAFDRSVDT
jgi:DNA-binding response OmpR family regulator